MKKNANWSCSRHFTLVEVVAVVMIMMIVLGVGAVSIRKSSKNNNPDRCLNDFAVYLARVRTRCLGEGVAREVVFYPGTRTFAAELSPYGAAQAYNSNEDDLDLVPVVQYLSDLEEEFATPENEEEAWAAEQRERKKNIPLTFVLPEAFQLTLGDESGELSLEDTENSEPDGIRLWRFFPDGSAAGNGVFYLRNSSSAEGDASSVRRVALSPLKGELTILVGDDSSSDWSQAAKATGQ